MEEDVLGTREEVVGHRYARCTRCGATVLTGEMRLVLAESGTSGTQQEELCPSCQQALESGQTDWQTEELDEA
jgi:hypothetical protein